VSDGAPRVQLVESADAPLLARPYFSPDGESSPIVRALAQVPELLPVAMPFVAQVLGASAVDLRTKELIILRVSHEAGCVYCVGAHRLAAADAGVEAVEDAALRGLVPLERAFGRDELELLRLCDAIAGGGDVPDRLIEPVRRRLGEHGLVEVVMVAATTLMLNRFCTSLRLPLTTASARRLRALDHGSPA
jgi:AhpD family alkylhydroperoxidase